MHASACFICQFIGDLGHPLQRSTAQVSSMSAPASAQESARSLYKNIITTYERARENGAAYKTDTHTEVYKDDLHGIEFVLRVAAALRDKPRPAKERQALQPAEALLCLSCHAH